MPNIRALNKKKYNISKHRFMELYHFCLQYPEWQQELADLTCAVKGVDTSGDGISGNGTGDPTARLAMKRAELTNRCELIRQTAIEADPELWQWILRAVTNEGTTYNTLEIDGIPCGRDTYYDRRRKFYYLLSKRIG